MQNHKFRVARPNDSLSLVGVEFLVPSNMESKILTINRGLNKLFNKAWLLLKFIELPSNTSSSCQTRFKPAIKLTGLCITVAKPDVRFHTQRRWENCNPSKTEWKISNDKLNWANQIRYVNYHTGLNKLTRRVWWKISYKILKLFTNMTANWTKRLFFWKLA